jgi:acyl carrier protein
VDSLEQMVAVLNDVLRLGPRAAALRRDSPLHGSMIELDSMAVVSLISALEERFGIAIDDVEIDASIFATVGSLVDFVDSKLAAASY